MTKTTEAPKVEKMARPARLWRNRFIALKDGITYGTGRRFKCGDIYHGTHVFPSKDVAEQAYADHIAQALIERNGRPFTSEYLGSFPVES